MTISLANSIPVVCKFILSIAALVKPRKPQWKSLAGVLKNSCPRKERVGLPIYLWCQGMAPFLIPPLKRFASTMGGACPHLWVRSSRIRGDYSICTATSPNGHARRIACIHWWPATVKTTEQAERRSEAVLGWTVPAVPGPPFERTTSRRKASTMLGFVWCAKRQCHSIAWQSVRLSRFHLKVNRRVFLKTVGAGFLAFVTLASVKASLEASRPNMLFFFPDEHRFDWTSMNPA